MREQSFPYEDILNCSRPASSHPHMSRQERAKIFSPFSALKGYEDAVALMQEQRCDRHVLSEYEIGEISAVLSSLQRGDQVTVSSFFEDPGPDGSGGQAEGRYLTSCGEVLCLDRTRQILLVREKQPAMQEVEIRFEDIWQISLD